MSELPVQRWDFDAPLWDQCTFIGRVKYYAWITDPRLNFVSTSCFHQAKHLRTLYLLGMEPAETTKQHLLFAKRLYENAYHPDNNEYTRKLGRMSFMAIGNALTLGPMMTYYRSTTAVVFWQWANQSFNAFVNYTNRNANSPLTEKQMGIAYVSATAAACVTAIGFKKWLAKQASPLIQRYVPFAAVAAANCVNIPLMRQNEFLGGIDVFSDDGTKVGTSKLAAVKGISEVVLSRIIMCAPGMNIMPLIMKRMETRCWFRKATWFHAPFQTLMVGGFLTVMVPVACGIFPQKCGISTSMIERFEPEEYEKLKKFCKGKVPETVFFNKGL